MTAPSASAARGPSSPPWPFGSEPAGAVALVAARDVAGRTVLHGSFRVASALLGPVSRPLQRHLVLVARRGLVPVASMPWRELLLFPEDDRESQGFVHGCFEVAVEDALGTDAASGPITCFVSLGACLSNAVRVELAGPGR